MPRKSNKRALKIALDTNTIFTQVFGELIPRDVASMIESQSRHLDLEISWHIPELVRWERQYQLGQAALDLLPSIEKVEKLLGHKLNINSENLTQCVERYVTSAIQRHTLNVIKLDHTQVEWQQVLEAAAFRRPPFQPGKTEKGFRDAIILEAFMQLVRSSPKTPSICRLVLVSADARVREAAEERTKDHANVLILESISELQGFINTLVSQVGEDVVADIRKKAGAFFFEPKNEQTYMYREKVTAKIMEQFSEALAALPPDATSRSDGTWYIALPEFVRKENQTFFWKTPISLTTKAYKPAPAPEPAPLSDYLQATSRASASGVLASGALGLLDPKLFGGRPPILVAEGKTKFEVHWSIRVDHKRRLSNPVVISIEHGGTEWTVG